MSLSKLDKPTIINECETKKFRREFMLPEVKTLFKIARNPFDCNPKVAQWVDQVFKNSLMDTENFKKVKCVTIFPAYFYPFCADIKRYETLVKLFLLFGVFDDHSECSWGDVARNSERSRQIWGQMETGLKSILDNNLSLSTDGWKGYAKDMLAVHQQMCSAYNDVQKKRFVDVWRMYIEKNKEENDNIGPIYCVKDINEILEMRKHTAAIVPSFQSIEFADNISVTEQEWDSMKELMDTGAKNFIICNDIYSFEKEYSEQDRQLDRMYNVVAHTALDKQIPIKKAMKEMAQLHIFYEKKCMDLIEKLQSGAISKDMSIFLDRFNHMIGGHFHASLIIDRYNKPFN